MFIDDSLCPEVGRFARMVGRPRLDWVSQVVKAGANQFGSLRTFEGLLSAMGEGAVKAWKREF